MHKIGNIIDDSVERSPQPVLIRCVSCKLRHCHCAVLKESIPLIINILVSHSAIGERENGDEVGDVQLHLSWTVLYLYPVTRGYKPLMNKEVF